MLHLPWWGGVQGQGLHRGCAAAFAGRGEVPLEFYGDKGADIKKKPRQSSYLQLSCCSPVLHPR